MIFNKRQKTEAKMIFNKRCTDEKLANNIKISNRNFVFFSRITSMTKYRLC